MANSDLAKALENIDVLRFAAITKGFLSCHSLSGQTIMTGAVQGGRNFG
jgi:hypothetical protein